MQFNFTTSNPAFNIAEDNNIAGTGGNTTLYRTSTRFAFDKLLSADGILLNITLKGIIPDLVDKHFDKYQILDINLMDDIKVWPYNTCYFLLQKTLRTTVPTFSGGLASKIYSYNPIDCFPFTYYSGADKGMKGFDSSYDYNVIRKLPGRNNDSFVYDYTNQIVPSGPKFAFTVLESKKSYSVTDEPIRGGTICYITTPTIELAEKLKLFVEHNEVFKTYVERTNQKNHAFALRNVKAFDLNQIVTGKEIPVEWNITEEDLQEPKELYNEVIEDRNKVKTQGQVYTPKSLVDKCLDDLEKASPNAFKDPKKTFIDCMAGNGKFLLSILEKKMQNGISKEDSLKTIYGVELDLESAKECKQLLAGDDKKLLSIVDNNIVCADCFNFDYNFGQKDIFDKFFINR
tara:strand:- start:113 stop:1318 length:1206 start_codon:yes stop_codon:yes gene_type:complete